MSIFKKKTSAVDDNGEDKELWCTAGRNLVSIDIMKKRMEFPSKIEPSYDSVILLLSTFPRKMKSVCWKDIYILIFTAELFIIANIWILLKCPQVDEWLKKCGLYIYNRMPLSYKREGNPILCNDKSEPGVHYIKWNKPGMERKKAAWANMWNLQVLNLK